jgi:hypothetical protein
VTASKLSDDILPVFEISDVSRASIEAKGAISLPLSSSSSIALRVTLPRTDISPDMLLLPVKWLPHKYAETPVLFELLLEDTLTPPEVTLVLPELPVEALFFLFNLIAISYFYYVLF